MAEPSPPEVSVAPPPAAARLLARAAAISPVLRGAASLYGSTVITSALGFLFWLLAARTLSPHDVGRASAAISAATLVATICLLGLGTLAIAELAEDRSAARHIISTTGAAATAASLVGSVVVVVVLAASGTSLLHTGSLIEVVLFVLLGAGTGATLLLDDASIGLLRGGIQLARNVVASVVKVALLPVLAATGGLGGGTRLILAWTVSLLLSVVVALVLVDRRTEATSWRPSLGYLVARRRLIGAHHFLNLSISAPRLVFPVVVAAMLGSAANAGFTAALLVTTFVVIIPAHLSTALFAVAPGDEQRLARECRSSMRICLVLSAVTAVFFLAASHLVLRIFNPAYVDATTAMIWLGLTTLPASVKALYVAIARVHGRMTQAAVASTATAVLQVVAVVVGASIGGLGTVGFAVLLAQVVEAAIFLRPVLGVLRTRPLRTPARRRAAPPVLDLPPRRAR
jgi:O-antigen/teichoic acid export membrane protein